MTFLEMEMKEIDRNTCNDTNNITSLISTRLKYVLDISKTEQAFTVEEYKHTHTNTNTHTQTPARANSKYQKYIPINPEKNNKFRKWKKRQASG